MSRLIDLGSDTATRPSAEMLSFMVNAPVGDDQRQEDPTVNALQDRVADLLGHEKSLFLPSATMANEIALKVQTQPGDEVIVEHQSHYVTSEAGSPGFLSSVMLHTVVGQRGIFTAEQFIAGVRRKAIHAPRTRAVCVEQTTNRGGGAVWSVEQLQGVVNAARSRDIYTHMDGSRLLNAVVASGIDAATHAREFDSVTLCLSKGLGCPVGALLAGSSEFIQEAQRYKHIFGGAMRQAGFVAAAGLYALEHNVLRLAQDHDNARRLAQLLDEIPGVSVDLEAVETNIVFFDVRRTGMGGSELINRLARRGVRMGAWPGETQVRAVTHMDVSGEEIAEAAAIVAEVVLAYRRECMVDPSAVTM
ncbi:threonine aldolase family protein [Paraburkholderia sp.]|uniref:threonine aldolase family protein n=1 Tax=Paraburkholderia sp. TaxID=1926495 RepID=UPI0039E3A9A1